tara:strand:- start:244 stop:534 length:291 start_codon:yes stop_codon:yes gene_type:complete
MAEKTSAEKQQTAQPTEGTVTTPQAEAPALTVADLRNIRMIIDISSQRGAFKGGELATIGSVFDKLDTFLKSVDAKADVPQPVPTQTTEQSKAEDK